MGGDSGFGHGGLVIVFMSSHEVTYLKRERERERRRIRNINEKKRETQLKKQILKYQLATITSYL